MTNVESVDEVPAAPECDPRALSARERTLHLAASTQLLVRERIQLVELMDGFELHLAPARGRLVELARWVERESACCPWMDFVLTRRADGVLRLALRARAPGAKDMIGAALEAATALAQGAAIPPELAAPTRALHAADFRQIVPATSNSECECTAGSEAPASRGQFVPAE